MESAQTPQNSEEEPTPKAPVWPRPARELTPSREAARWHQASFSEEKQQNAFKKCVQKLVEEVLIPPKKSFLIFFSQITPSSSQEHHSRQTTALFFISKNPATWYRFILESASRHVCPAPARCCPTSSFWTQLRAPKLKPQLKTTLKSEPGAAEVAAKQAFGAQTLSLAVSGSTPCLERSWGVKTPNWEPWGGAWLQQPALRPRQAQNLPVLG